MFQLFNKKPLNLLGIDISSTSIKLLELSKSVSNFRVEAFAIEPLPVTAVVEKSIRNVEEVGAAIARAVARANPSSDLAATAVAGSAVITKIIQMSADLSETELESQIELGADRYIPYKLDEVSLDFEVLGPSASAANMVDVLLAASRTEHVDLCREALELGGLRAKVVDVESYAIARAYHTLAAQMDNQIAGSSPAAAAATTAIVDVGAAVTTFNVFQNQQIIYSRELVFGGRQLFEELQRCYGLNSAAALEAIYANNLPPACEAEVLQPFREIIAQQVNRSLQFFFSASNCDALHQLVLAGGVARLAGLADHISFSTGMKVSIADPFTHMQVAKSIPQQVLTRWAPAMLISCGLALRSFN